MMAFRWKDRSGAVNMAAVVFAHKCNFETARIQTSSMEGCLGSQETLESVADYVIGSGSVWQNFFCLDPERVTQRQYRGFLRDIKRKLEEVWQISF